MYEAYWRLTEAPFDNTPNPRFFYHSHEHEEGLARMLYVIRQRKAAGMLSGVYGCGKTLIANSIKKELEKDIYRIGIVTNPRLSDIELVRRIAYSLGMQSVPSSKADVEVLLERALNENMKDGKRTVIIIDEAHTIPNADTFEELRLLLNLQTESQFLFTLLLMGQPELREKVKENKQFDQRIAMRYHLEPLKADETAAYVAHRLSVAGAGREIFQAEAVRMVHERSGGIPRRINMISDAALLIGFGKQKTQVDSETVLEALETVGGG